MLIDFDDFCRLEDCVRDDLHPAHPAPYRKPGDVERGVIVVKPEKISKRQVIYDSVLGAVSMRILKPFREVVSDVQHDYGAVTPRVVYYTLSNLINLRRVALVVPHGSADRLRDGGNVVGGYVRFDSPLLQQRDGLHALMSQADDLADELYANLRQSRKRRTGAVVRVGNFGGRKPEKLAA